MAASTVMTIRIDPALLSALRSRAREEGRSVSAEVVRLIRQAVEARLEPAARRSGFGLFAGLESVEIAEIRALRRGVTASATRPTRTRRRS